MLISARVSILNLLFIGGIAAISGCAPAPETVPTVDLNRYVGLWYQVAGYPFGPTDGMVGITAEYALREDGKVSVLNRGYMGSFDGPLESIEGVARVVDPESNAKLAVTFPSVFFGLFEGQYWIIDLDAEDYSYAVVSDPLRFTLFILTREPIVEEAFLDELIADLGARGFDTGRIERFAQREPVAE